MSGPATPRRARTEALRPPVPIGRRAWLRLQWQRSSWLIRIGWIVGAVVAVGLVANLILQPAPVTYAGSFVATGSMGAPRAGATATLLSDGRVLVAGGTSDGKASVGSAELYDPRSGTFSATGSMVMPRESATAVLLSDGRVLIAGGNGTDDTAAIATQSSAELYDPRTGTFTTTGSMTTARVNCTMTLLADGRVLMAGGSNEHERVELTSAELYDPTTGTFTTTGPMKTGREGAAAALLPDGRVLVAGGAISVNTNTGTFTSSAELFDPQTGTFSATGSMAMALEWRAATLLIDGRVLVAGGRGLPDTLDGTVSAELYDPATGLFSATGVMRSPRAGPRAIGLVDGRVLVAGDAAAAELYDPIRDTFSPTGPMVEPRSGGTATILANGQVLFAGGGVGIRNLASAELFH